MGKVTNFPPRPKSQFLGFLENTRANFGETGVVVPEALRQKTDIKTGSETELRQNIDVSDCPPVKKKYPPDCPPDCPPEGKNCPPDCPPDPNYPPDCPPDCPPERQNYPPDCPPEDKTVHLTVHLKDHPPDCPPDCPSDYPPDYPLLKFEFSSIKNSSINNGFLGITNRQAEILKFLISKKEKVSQVEEIEQHTGIAKGTVKWSLRVLSRLRFISKKKQCRKGEFQGFSYSLNSKLCEQFLKELNNKNFESPSKSQPESSDAGFSVPSGGQLSTLLSTSIYLEEEDTFNLLLAPQKLALIHPVLTAAGLETLQIKDIFDAWRMQGMDLKLLPESLERAEYAVEHKSFKMNNPLNYVFSILMKGSFPKPPNYRSRAERMADEALAEAAAVQAKLRELRNMQFQNMLADPESELFQRCLAGVDEYARKRKSGPVFEAAMRAEFENHGNTANAPGMKDG